MLRERSTVIIGLSARTIDTTFCARPFTAPRHRLSGAAAMVNKNMAPVTLLVRIRNKKVIRIWRTEAHLGEREKEQLQSDRGPHLGTDISHVQRRQICNWAQRK